MVSEDRIITDQLYLSVVKLNFSLDMLQERKNIRSQSLLTLRNNRLYLVT